MNAKVVNIGRYIKVPYDVVMSKISPRAFQVWTAIAAEASPEHPIAHVHQPTLAKLLRCSTQTIGRALAELMQNDLLNEAGKWQQGKCKSYRLNWNPRVAKEMEPKRVIHADVQLSLPSECYIRVGPKEQIPLVGAALEPEGEEAWIIAQIKASNEEQRYKEDLEAKRKAALGGRGRIFAPTKSLVPETDEAITPENYPIMWEFLRIQWSNRRERRVA